eukprot:g66597.t1
MAGSFKKQDWFTMSLAARNKAYNNGLHVGLDKANLMKKEWAKASVIFRQKHNKCLDIPYGPAPRSRWDLFPGKDPFAPCHVHIHGGWWYMGCKEDIACMLEGTLSKGWAAALPGYTLAPAASLTEIIHQL